MEILKASSDILQISKFGGRVFQQFERLKVPWILHPKTPIPKVNPQELRIDSIPLRFIHPHILSDFEACGLDIALAHWFVTPPRHTLPVHIDGPEHTRYNNFEYNFYCGLNIDISNGQDAGGVMRWYTSEKRLKIEPIAPPLYYQGQPTGPVKQFAEHHVEGPCVVHTGVLHSMENLTDKPRYCLSFRFSRDLTIEHVINRLERVWDTV